MTWKNTRTALVAIVILTATFAAQTIAPDTVYVTVRVTDSKKEPALGLKADNFQILEDGVEQKVSSFSAPSEPWDMRVLLAASAFQPSGQRGADPKAADVIRAASIAFKLAGNSANKYKIEEWPTYQSDPFDPIKAHLEELNRSGNPKRAVIVIMDDYHLQVQKPPSLDLLKYSRQFSTPVYFIFVGNKVPIGQQSLIQGGSTGGVLDHALDFPDPSTSRGTFDTGWNSQTIGQVLSNLASESGGDAYLIPSKKLMSRLLQLAADMKNEYALGFKSTNAAKDGSWRQLKITVKSPTGQKLIATSKDKYFVAKP